MTHSKSAMYKACLTHGLNGMAKEFLTKYIHFAQNSETTDKSFAKIVKNCMKNIFFQNIKTTK